jgi:hypothetical protein
VDRGREGGREGAGVGSDTGPTTITFPFLAVGYVYGLFITFGDPAN